MNFVTPEQRGISSEYISQYIKYLEDNQLSTHSVILMRGDDILFEKYWAPFHRDFQHRQYSASKSLVAIAVGFAEQEGLLNLDDPICKYYPEEMKDQADENMRNQTVRHMLMMSTAKLSYSWFAAKPDDRVKFYLSNPRTISRPSGSIFQYDSTGSFVLGALVEKVSGKTLTQYLQEKLFSKIGVSPEARFLKCPGGCSWGDSALLCTSRDLLKTARFMLNGGRWNGQQILNKAFVQAAVSKQIDNNVNGVDAYNSQGYGYLIWRTWQNSFFFNGMGCQFAVCVPDKDVVFVYNADNQGHEGAQAKVIDGFFSMIVNHMQDDPLPEDSAAQKALEAETADLKLMTAKGAMTSPWMDKVNGVTYVLGENDFGIEKLRLDFCEDGSGRMVYTNAQGEKELLFAMGKNAFGVFPQEGYADEVGTVATKNRYYKCAASAAWTEPHKLFIKVQIIDNYFGRLNITLSFRDDTVGVFMAKTAEDFLGEYEGFAGGIACR